MSRLSRWSAGLVAALLAVAVLAPLPFAIAQPPASSPALPSPLDLVRGLREQGMPDMALELLKEIEGSETLRKQLRDGDEAAIPLERAKCQLEAADDEPDEGARAGLVAEAKEGFSLFLKKNKDHPRAAEASLALARLTSLDAKAILAKARRVEDEAQEKLEAARARPLFQRAADLFKAAAEKLDEKLKQPDLDANLRRGLEQEKFEAELARGINQFYMGDTFINPTAKEKGLRSDLIEQARDIFAKLGSVPNPGRSAWVARAWMAECLVEQAKHTDATEEFNRILATTTPAAEDGIRTVKFFQLRRKLFDGLGSKQLPDILAAEQMARRWLTQYGNVRRARAEATATRWYLAFNLHSQALNLLVWSKKKDNEPPKLLSVPDTAKRLLAEAEKLYRVVSQSDNEYSHRAARKRMEAVRLLLGEADRPPGDYKTFEECQMASLIQIAKLIDMERDGKAKPEELKAKRLAIVALLERARERATGTDTPPSDADVADVLIRLIFFYEATDQPQQAAILGEYIAREYIAKTIKVPGGKAATAGSLGLAGYSGATGQLKIDEAEKLDAARRADRDRAIRLARFLDEKFPTDSATDRARHRLGALLYEEGKLVEAYDALVKVRPGYDQVANARLFQGAIAAQLLTAKDSTLPEGRRAEVFNRTITDLDKTVRPSPGADVAEVKAYVNGRCRLALLYLLKSRVLGADADKTDPGYVRAQQVAKDTLEVIPTFTRLVGADKDLTLDGWELKLLAEDARTRAVYLRGQSAYSQQKYDDVFGAIGDVLGEMNKEGRYADMVKKVAGEAKPEMKEPEKKEPPKKEAEKQEPEPGDEDSAAKSRVAKLAGAVDKLRQELIVLGLKARVKQGQIDKASELLDLLKRFGGNIEANVATLQQLSAELAAQIVALKRDGKVAEAKVLTDGFAKLLEKLGGENLPPSMQLFMGQALIVVGEPNKASEALKKVPPPKNLAWLTMPADKLQDDEKRQVAEYRRATLELARAYRLGKKYVEADNVLKSSMGTREKPGWAFSSIEFRKEVPYLFEARAAEEPNPKPAKELWGLALQEWNGLYTMMRNRVQEDLKTPPKDANGNVNNQLILQHKNAFFESFYDVTRCVVKANLQLLKGNPAELQKKIDDAAKKFVDQEKSNGPEIIPEVRMKYYELLQEVPELKKAYQAAGGKLFLEKPAGQ